MKPKEKKRKHKKSKKQPVFPFNLPFFQNGMPQQREEQTKKEKEEDFLKVKIEKYESENEKLFKELENLALILEEKRQKKQELDSIELQTDPKEMNKVLLGKEKDLYEVKYQVDKLNSEKNQLFKQLQEAKAEETRFNEKAERIFNENEKVKDKIDEVNYKIQSLTRETEDQREEIVERKEVIGTLKSELSAVKVDNLQVAQFSAENKAKIEILKKKLEKNKFLKGNLGSDYENLQENSANMKMKFVLL